jgi:iron complex outermembrane receptor protein
MKTLNMQARPALWAVAGLSLVWSSAANELTNSLAEFKQMSLEQLMNQEVTMVSRKPEPLSESPSAIQVIRGEDIRRSGALTLAQALRLAPNLQVAQQNAHDWAITSRGFNGAPLSNNSLANKLLVMIDGRSVYTPLFGGVFWDAQQVLLEDIDRIEVVSGPGASLWGDNAVNGVINVVTKSAKDTQGLFLSGGAGSFMQDMGAVRYGGKAGTNFFYRVYVQRFDHKSTKIQGLDQRDDWEMSQGGFRMDYYPGTADTLTFQSDFYETFEGRPRETELNGENVLGRWTHTISQDNELSLQTYFDRTWREFPTQNFAEELITYDVDFQHRFPLGSRQAIIWGADYRQYEDKVRNAEAISFDPEHRTLQLFSGFIQDEISVVADVLKLTLGTKLEHNDYSGLEVQPTGRLTWMLTKRQTIWGAISRAARSPTRFDSDIKTALLGRANRDFDSEKVVAYELGYRVRPHETLSLSFAAFYNTYEDFRSVNHNATPPPLLYFANDQEADSYGFEISGDYRPWEWWRMRGGYSFVETDVHATGSNVLPESQMLESIDPHHQVTLQSIMTLPHDVQFDLVGRYVSSLPATTLPTQGVPDYITFDARLAWSYKNVEFALIGQNLAQPAHREFGSRDIPRSVFGKVTFRF